LSYGIFPVNFRSVTEQLLTSFHEKGIEYALIGGFAVGLWGVTRGTLDMDFLIRRDDLHEIDPIMDALGYSIRHRSDNVSQYFSSSGEVDFLHAFRSHTLGMLKRAVEKPVFAGSFTVRVLRPEDLIGLKLQAIANNQERERLDMYDIEELMRLHDSTMEWRLLEEYFDIFDMQTLFAALKRKYHVDR
jgi:hypothetical protein